MSHLPFEQTVRYVAGDLTDDETSDFEAHYFGCARCTRAIAEVQALTSVIGAMVPPIVDRQRVVAMRESGARLGETTVPDRGDVHVYFTRDVDFLVHTLVADRREVQRIDVELESLNAEVLTTIEAAPYDPQTGEVFVVCQRHFADMGFPDDVRFRVVGVEGEERVSLGEFTVRHHFEKST